MIEAKNLKKWYGTNCAVNDVSFDVKKGEVLGFLGPNGAGKSTTMRMITGFLHLDGGSVHIGEHNIEDEPKTDDGTSVFTTPYTGKEDADEDETELATEAAA